METVIKNHINELNREEAQAMYNRLCDELNKGLLPYTDYAEEKLYLECKISECEIHELKVQLRGYMMQHEIDRAEIANLKGTIAQMNDDHAKRIKITN